MAKVGRFVTDPKAGAYCEITLDNGEGIIVNHNKGGFKGGRLTIEKTKWMGMASDRVVEVDLDRADGRRALAQVTVGAPPDSVRATPLGAFVEYVKDCASVADVKATCDALLAARG